MRLAIAFHLQTLCVHLDQGLAVFIRAQQLRAPVCIALNDFLFGMAEAVALSHGEYRRDARQYLAAEVDAGGAVAHMVPAGHVLADYFRRDVCCRLRAIGLVSFEHRQARNASRVKCIRRYSIRRLRVFGEGRLGVRAYAIHIPSTLTRMPFSRLARALTRPECRDCNMHIRGKKK